MSGTKYTGDDVLVSIIIPAYNEEGAIGDTVLGIQELELPNSEILVVDDGGTDATARVAAAAGARVISHPYNIGNGAAVKTGIRSARGKVLVFLDGDGQHDPADIPRLISGISKYHMVIGARQRSSETSLHRDLANWVYNKLASYVASFRIEDLTSGFRAMRSADARRFVDLFPNRFSYPTTSTLAFLRSGRSIKYIPIVTKWRVGKSKIKIFKDGPKFLMIIAKIIMTFSPLRVFLPVSFALFSSGLAWYVYTYFSQGRFTNMSALVFNTSVILFMLGMVAEQVASLRLEKADRLFTQEDAELYKVFEQYPETRDVQPNYADSSSSSDRVVT